MNFSKHHFALKFIDELAALSFDNVFNPYTDTCPKYDIEDAPLIRRRNLELVLDAAISSGIDSMWIARDLGYRGGRRTGLALTDDTHISWYADLLGTPPLRRATLGPALTERTATIVWNALHLIDRPIFLWNVFPLHPHAPGDAMSNRCHTKVERSVCKDLLAWLIETLRPGQVIAIGRDAHIALGDLGVEALLVRHPSYGGQSKFLAGLTAHYGISFISDPQQDQLCFDI